MMRQSVLILALLGVWISTGLPASAPQNEDEVTRQEARSLDPDLATPSYLDRLTPEQRASSESYWNGGYWVSLLDFLLGLVIGWLWSTAVMVGFLVFLLIISPVFVDPLFNTYTPMDEGPLKERILQLARLRRWQPPGNQMDLPKQHLNWRSIASWIRADWKSGFSTIIQVGKAVS